MSAPDFLTWLCANCGAKADGTKKPCDCVTVSGFRKGPNGKMEYVVFDEPPTETQSLITRIKVLEGQ